MGRRAERAEECCVLAWSGGALGWDPGVPAGGEPGFPRLSEGCGFPQRNQLRAE